MWDPVGLFPFAPIDEYNIEIENVINQIKEQDSLSAQIISKIICLIYNESFGDIFCSTEEECMWVAERVFEILES